ncbi:glycoside hydrolase family 6 protein [Actinoplanes sp. NPDC051861]|uniref:glycoside hydrolase family 6 protein n=1 Tax=Actinoplanes sp. NPDC051861 TaxID=3155170 RepID=UPI0034484A66
MSKLPALCALVGIALLGGCSGSSPQPAPVQSESAVTPTGVFFVEPDAPAVEQVVRWEGEGRAGDAAAMRRIAEAPTAVWFADGAAHVERAQALVAAARAAGTTPVLVAYNVPQRDCGGHSGGGAADADEYRAWIAGLAGALRGSPAVVILEPDAVTHVLQGCVPGAERFALLDEAIRAFKQEPGIRVYLDGGNPGWVRDVDRVADALRRAGVERADGFSLNVANFETVEANVGYGEEISRRLGGAHFVIDTSRNGNGPASVDARNAEGHWCNPAGRALGPAPTTETGHPLVDAYLWVKRPGESDGACGEGAPPAGQWWPEYALGLATN